MVDEVDSSHLGGILDTIPMAINGETPKEYCNALKEKLFHIHFIDGTPICIWRGEMGSWMYSRILFNFQIMDILGLSHWKSLIIAIWPIPKEPWKKAWGAFPIS